MESAKNTGKGALIERIRDLIENKDIADPLVYHEIDALVRSVLYDTLGANHPLMANRDGEDFFKFVAAGRGVIHLYETDELRSQPLAIAHEIEGDILDIAEERLKASENSEEPTQKQLLLAIAAFLTGAALEDALRRMCDARGLDYDRQHSTICKLSSLLYQPKEGIKVITVSENDYLTAWAKTRNNADHGHFNEITQKEVKGMIDGVRGFIDKHLLWKDDK